ncbi:MAG: primosomal protein N' [Oscillospiraceae bacterium]|jgi:primosomal protein N' (replication factor Y)|nr:primosomal protein N' [Oscillospiraceae bacterium]
MPELLPQTFFAQVAVSKAVFHIDAPFTYRVPPELCGKVTRGSRVVVPFGAGNKNSEGIVLSVKDTPPDKIAINKIKPVLSAMDDGVPPLPDEFVSLAVWMAKRFYSTVSDSYLAALPAGMRFREEKNAVAEKTVKVVRLTVSPEEAADLAKRLSKKSPRQSALLSLLSEFPELEQKTLTSRTGTSGASVHSLLVKGLVEISEVKVSARPKYSLPQDENAIVLNSGQYEAYSELSPLLKSEKAETALLYGVTGSGKTAVYIKLIEQTLEQGRGAIVLVPEIALTPQLVGIFVARFGDDVAVIHSGLTPRERFDEWTRIRDGKVKIAVGTRSAIFAPLRDIGLIVIDEEQETTYKAEMQPRYAAAEVALWIAARHRALVLFGSATPGIETMYRAKTGKIKLVRLPTRYNEMRLPEVIVADMKSDTAKDGPAFIGNILRQELAANIERGEQSILFVNRRGTHPIVACTKCGHTFICRNCSVNLNYHNDKDRLYCHYCGYSEKKPEYCPECGAQVRFFGAGTQKFESELREMFSEAAVMRMDRDALNAGQSHEKLLNRFRDEKIPILIGTQMVAKGLDFPNVTLVGVLSPDLSLYSGDYRANERTFSQITQVIGRSGRGEKPGRAVIQTFTPENKVIALASRQDYDGFYDYEIERRLAANQPPATRITGVSVIGQDEIIALRGAHFVCNILTELCGNRAQVLGPVPHAVARVNKNYIFRITALTASPEDEKHLQKAVRAAFTRFYAMPESRSITLYADLSPND